MLVEAEDEHFIWMLGGPAADCGFRLPPGGVDEPPVLNIIRRMSSSVRATYGAGTWMIVVDGEVVGLCSFKTPPDLNGTVEIGYGVAQSRRARGHATRAIADLLGIAARSTSIRSLVAETRIENVASQRVLERNGFTMERKRLDSEDGEILVWTRDLSSQRL